MAKWLKRLSISYSPALINSETPIIGKPIITNAASPWEGQWRYYATGIVLDVRIDRPGKRLVPFS